MQRKNRLFFVRLIALLFFGHKYFAYVPIWLEFPFVFVRRDSPLWTFGHMFVAVWFMSGDFIKRHSSYLASPVFVFLSFKTFGNICICVRNFRTFSNETLFANLNVRGGTKKHQRMKCNNKNSFDHITSHHCFICQPCSLLISWTERKSTAIFWGTLGRKWGNGEQKGWFVQLNHNLVYVNIATKKLQKKQEIKCEHRSPASLIARFRAVQNSFRPYVRYFPSAILLLISSPFFFRDDRCFLETGALKTWNRWLVQYVRSLKFAKLLMETSLLAEQKLLCYKASGMPAWDENSLRKHLPLWCMSCRYETMMKVWGRMKKISSRCPLAFTPHLWAPPPSQKKLGILQDVEKKSGSDSMHLRKTGGNSHRGMQRKKMALTERWFHRVGEWSKEVGESCIGYSATNFTCNNKHWGGGLNNLFDRVAKNLDSRMKQRHEENWI